jgi:uncharacterized protein (TIGR03435 family)
MLENAGMRELLAYAYDFSPTRIIFPDDLPRERFDLLFTLPRDYREDLKKELKARFGLVAHREKRMVDDLLLKVTGGDAPGLKSSTGANQAWRNWEQAGENGTTITGHKLNDLTSWFSRRMGKPVVNQTGLTGTYDLNLVYQTGTGQTDTEAFAEAVSNQLGLKFVPERELVEMLVVEKVK